MIEKLDKPRTSSAGKNSAGCEAALYSELPHMARSVNIVWNSRMAVPITVPIMTDDRDVNAALNIKRQGILKLKAEGMSVSAHRGLRKSGVLPVAAWDVGSLAR